MWVWVGVVIVLLVVIADFAGCKDSEAGLTGGTLVFEEHFDSPNPRLAENWRVGRVEGPPSKGGGPRSPEDAAGHWTVEDGHLATPGERNQPLWLTKALLPDDVRIEFDVWTDSDAGDIKFEVFGDGEHHESGYILIMGGWNNSISVIARQDEHEHGRIERADFVEKGKKYHMSVVRIGGDLRWYIDGALYLRRKDPDPLRGTGHRHFAFNNWKSKLRFDNLRIYSLTATEKGN